MGDDGDVLKRYEKDFSFVGHIAKRKDILSKRERQTRERRMDGWIWQKQQKERKSTTLIFGGCSKIFCSSFFCPPDAAFTRQAKIRIILHSIIRVFFGLNSSLKETITITHA